MTTELIVQLTAWLIGGIALGAVYMYLIARTVAAITPDGIGRGAVGWLLLRAGLAAGVLTLAAAHGAGPLLAVLLGFMAARTVAIRPAQGS